MPLSENRVIVACAGSGKTTLLVDEALAARDRRIAILTYTNNNLREINSRFEQRNSGVPKHVDLISWFSFLLQECARPYQRSTYSGERIESLLFVNQQSAKYVAETDTKRYYFANERMIFSDKIAKFSLACETNSKQCVTSRLRRIYTDLLIDEFQDLAGWDLDLIELFLQSGIRVTLVGDPRQHIYSTNPSAKNKQYLGVAVLELVHRWRQNGLCQVLQMSDTRRSNQTICDFSNRLWPNMPPMKSLMTDTTGHDGVFLVAKDAVRPYIDHFCPQVLRHNRRAESFDSPALNFGLAKGLQFNRVLIVPTGPICNYLKTGKLEHVMDSRDRLHVAITRARHSVAFVHDGPSAIVSARWPITNV